MNCPKPRTRDDYEVALICALRVEADALLNNAVVDTFWDNDFDHDPSVDTNAYTTGTIGQHNVVVICLPRLGKSSSTGAVNNLRWSFPNVKLAVVFGICGGVPDQGVRLGDLILSTAVVEYDLGKQYASEHVLRNDIENTLGPANVKVGALIRKLGLRVHRQAFQKRVSSILKEIEQEVKGSESPGLEHDIQYPVSYPHRHYSGCAICDNPKHFPCEVAVKSYCADTGCQPPKHSLSAEDTLDSSSARGPKVHFGRIGSADTVMKSGRHRNEISKRDELIAFEMEGAGVLGYISCVVVKAVCDYADAHKDKKWQPYAAAVAAAGVRAFLENWVPERPREGQSVATELGKGALNIKEPATRVLSSGQDVTISSEATSAFPSPDDQLAAKAFQRLLRFKNTFYMEEKVVIERPDLHTQIKNSLQEMDDDKRVFGISGLAGTGKSQLAKSYVRQTVSKGDYTFGLLLNGRSGRSLRHDLAKYAKLLRLCSEAPGQNVEDFLEFEATMLPDLEERHFQAMVTWLNLHGNSQWILLIDDVGLPRSTAESSDSADSSIESSYLDLNEFLLQLDHGTIILTSQHSTVHDLYPSIEVKGFDLEEGLQVLRQKLGNRTVSEEDLHSIVLQFEGHPLTLSCIASYLRRYPTISPARYLRMWDACDTGVLQHTLPISGNKSILKTLKLTFDRLDVQTQIFLKLCAFLDPTSIDRALFQISDQIPGSWSAEMPDLLKIFDEATGQASEVSLLGVRSGLEPSGESIVIFLHPTVHKLLQTMSLYEDGGSFPNWAIQIVGQALEISSASDRTIGDASLTRHIIQCQENLVILQRNGFELLEGTLPSTALLGRYFHRRGQIRLATRLYDKALRRYEALDRKLDNYHEIVSNRGLASRALGNIAKAKQCFTIVLRYQHGQDLINPKSFNLAKLSAATNAALSLRQDGQLYHALKQFKYLYKRYSKLNAGHPASFKKYRILQYMGVTHRENLELAKSEACLAQASQGLLDMFGLENSYTLFALRQLAVTWGLDHEVGKRECALSLLMFIQAQLVRLFEVNGIHDLETRRMLAHLQKLNWFYAGKDAATAVNVCNDFEAINRAYIDQVGPSRPVTLHTALEWAIMLYESGQVLKASAILTDTTGGYRKLKPFPKQGYDAYMFAARSHWRLGESHDDLDELLKALVYYNEVEDKWCKDEVQRKATGRPLQQDIVIERAALHVVISRFDGSQLAKDKLCLALTTVMQLEDIPREQQVWADIQLRKVLQLPDTHPPTYSSRWK